MSEVFLVGLGGAIGSILRYEVGQIFQRTESGFPLGTLCINVLGSLCIAMISSLAIKYGYENSRLTLLLKTGICGGFTTFSTFSLESMNLLKEGNTIFFFSYICCTVLFSFLAIYIVERVI